VKIFYRTSRSFLFLLFKVLYRHKTFGIEHIPKGRAVIAPNHVSYYDPPVIAVSCPDEVNYLAKEDLFSKGLLGPLIRQLNAFPVPSNASDVKTIKLLVSFLRKDKKIMIFPEGSRAMRDELGPIKPGIARIAMRGDAPIVPTLIHGTFDIWPRQNKYPKLSGRSFCAFGPPIYPGKYHHLDRKEAQTKITEELALSIALLRKRYSFAEGV